MPHRRRVQKGSFASDLDELVAQLHVSDTRAPRNRGDERPRKLQDKIDIHTLLFERAWKLNSER